MARISAAINRCLVQLVEPVPDVGKAGQAGVGKLIARGFLNGGLPSAREASLLLTKQEHAALFSGARRWVVRQAGRFFLAGAVIRFAERLIFGGPENTAETRLQIISAHVTKAGPLWSKAFGVVEQVIFLLTDNLGEALVDAAAGIFSNFDDPRTIPAGLGRFDRRGYYDELLQPVANLDQVDTVIDAPGFLLQPGFVPFLDQQAETFPSGPRPSFGQRR